MMWTDGVGQTEKALGLKQIELKTICEKFSKKNVSVCQKMSAGLFLLKFAVMSVERIFSVKAFVWLFMPLIIQKQTCGSFLTNSTVKKNSSCPVTGQKIKFMKYMTQVQDRVL